MKEEGKVGVLYAGQFDHPNPEDIADLCFDSHRKYHIHGSLWMVQIEDLLHNSKLTLVIGELGKSNLCHHNLTECYQ
jgi:hypothetical protein